MFYCLTGARAWELCGEYAVRFSPLPGVHERCSSRLFRNKRTALLLCGAVQCCAVLCHASSPPAACRQMLPGARGLAERLPTRTARRWCRRHTHRGSLQASGCQTARALQMHRLPSAHLFVLQGMALRSGSREPDCNQRTCSAACRAAAALRIRHAACKMGSTAK